MIAITLATILAVVCGCLLVYSIRVTMDWNEAAERLMRSQFVNPYARLLGKTVEAKVYEGSDWERMVIIAVSWKGAVCVRRELDMVAPGRWIHKSKVPCRVREIDGDGTSRVDAHGRPIKARRPSELHHAPIEYARAVMGRRHKRKGGWR